MTVLNLLGHICDHPLNRNRKIGALLDFIRWQVRSRLARGYVIYPWLNEARVMVRNGDTGFTMNIYCGLYDLPEMTFLLHVLRMDDLFVDVGANIGSYTILASAVRHARSICFEPIPETFSRLEKNLRLNDLAGLVTANNVGVSDKPAQIRFSVKEDCCNHVLRDDEKGESLEVPVVTLDEALGSESPNVMKIDVEGFEWPVLNGARKLLENPALHSILLEFNNDLYGYGQSALLDLLRSHGFSAYTYDPFQRKLTSREPTPGNLLFIRDLERVEALLRSSESFRVKNVDL
jgi:FkbM family methyltransferase